MESMTVGLGRPVVIGEGPGDVGSQLVASRNGGGFPARKPARPPGQTPEVEETKMRKLGIVVTALACLTIMAFAAQAATAPVGEDMKGQMTIGVMGGVAMPAGKLAADYEDDGAKMKMGFGGGACFDYFFTKDMALGLDASYVTMKNKDDEDQSVKTLQFGVHGKYLVPTGGPIVPYLFVGGGLYNRKAEFTDGGVSLSLSDSKPGIMGGVGVGYKINEMVAVGVNGAYNYTIGKFEPEIDGTKTELLKDWNYMTFNLGLEFHIPKAK
jgi:opacity protein-like surface antigen